MKAICLIAQSVYDFDPRVRRKAEALAAAGYTVDVLALRPSDGRKTYTLNGVNVSTISVGKKRGSLARYLYEYAVFFVWALVRVPLQMRKRRYAVVDVNTLPDFLVFAPVVARWMGAKIILDMHEITPEFYMSKYGIPAHSLLVRVLAYLEKISFNFADHVITINEPILDLLISRGLAGAKSTVVMNAVDEANFAVGSKAAAPVGPAPDTFVMMYHGTLTRIYGLDLAIEAFAIAHGDMPGAEIWILGSGTEAGPLKALSQKLGLESKVKLVGQVPSTDIPGWLARCDLGLLPIRQDVFLDFAFPNKLPEFIIAGKAVLISRLRTIRHYFSDEAVAFFKPNDASDLAAQMVRVFRDRTLRDRLVARAREEYAPIRWHLMKQRYLQVVDEAAGFGHRTADGSPAAETTALAR